MFYAEIILPILGGVYTYSCEQELIAGSVVEVPLGKKTAIGVVWRIFSEKPAFEVRVVGKVLYEGALVSQSQFELWEWMVQYYMCTPGEVMRAALPTILRKGDFQPYKRKKKVVSRDAVSEFSLPELSAAQEQALNELISASQDVALLWGVPSSGKSEVCFHAIAQALGRGEDVLLLLPEISLTTQFVGRVRKVFGDSVILYHSGLTDKRRAESYLQICHEKHSSFTPPHFPTEAVPDVLSASEKSRSAQNPNTFDDKEELVHNADCRCGSLVVGTRSAIFLPFRNLGLVVVDEEQDSSYKQQDPAPRYNARDAATVMAKLYGARTILASATPSLETWVNAQSDKYALIELSERFGGTEPPVVVISDTLRAAKRGERKSHFNKDLTDRLAGALGRGEQAILFQNRRGVAPYIECEVCGWVPRCDHCAIPMTVHRGSLRCHYCGAVQPVKATCPACGGAKLETRGFGTEKIEDELSVLFPYARIVRLDRDSAGSEKSYSNIIGTLESGEADILVGTQMVTKGLDFAGVSLVGILNADNLLNHPDFRATERAYQLLAQVAGRAGRQGERGKVVVQTAAPGNAIINWAAAGDYRSMVAELLQERQMYGYPPYGRLISVMLRHRYKEILSAAARVFGEQLRDAKFEVLGPQPPVTEKIKGEYALVFLIKIPRVVSVRSVRTALKRAMDVVIKTPEFRKVIITPDVDPQ